MSFVAETAMLVHGYTMASVDRIAGRVSALRSNAPMSHDDRYEHAWHGVVEELYRCGCGHLSGPEYCARPEGPTVHDLVAAGSAAVNRAVTDEYRHHGWNSKTHESTPSFSKYWRAIGGADDFTDRVIERLALPAVLGVLTPAEYEAVATLAAHGSQTEAAVALGMKPSAFSARMQSARERAAIAWHAPETPHRPKRRRLEPDGTCTYGHDLTEYGFTSSEGRLRCRKCIRAADRKSTAQAREKARQE